MKSQTERKGRLLPGTKGGPASGRVYGLILPSNRRDSKEMAVPNSIDKGFPGGNNFERTHAKEIKWWRIFSSLERLGQ